MSETPRIVILLIVLPIVCTIVWRLGTHFISKPPTPTSPPKNSPARGSQALRIITILFLGMMGLVALGASLLGGAMTGGFSLGTAGVLFYILLTGLVVGLFLLGRQGKH